MKILARLEASVSFWYLLLIVCVFFFLRFPSVLEPYWYGDEAIYQVLGSAMQEGRLLYRDIWDNKPPLLYSIYALFGPEMFTVKFVSLLFGLLSVIVFYFVAKKIFSEKLQEGIVLSITALFAVLFATPLLEGNIANAENFMLLPILLAALFILQNKESKPNVFFSAGLLLGIAFLFKIVAIFDTAAFAIFIFITHYIKRGSIPSFLATLIPFGIAFMLPITVTFFFFLLEGSLEAFVNAAFLQMFGYVNYGNTFIVSQGLLLIKLLLLFSFTLFLFLRRNRIPHTALFVFLWVDFSLFNAFFAQRPYTHYLLVLLPSFSLLVGMCLSSLKNSTSANVRGISLVILFVVLILIGKQFKLYEKNISYYQNFFFFMLNHKSVTEYRAFFDKNTPRDYALAQYINTHATNKDTVFIWGNNPQIYTLTGKLPPGRFTVTYHMTASNETMEETRRVLAKTKPHFIIMLPQKATIPFSLDNYNPRYTIYNGVIYERLF